MSGYKFFVESTLVCFLCLIWLYSNLMNVFVKGNRFNASVTTINGQVFVNWSIIGPWKSEKEINMSVYFLTNESILNGKRIKVCLATNHENSSWNIKSLQGNLLKFCDASKICGSYGENVTSLVDGHWREKEKELSCRLFTTCSNFSGFYVIQIIAAAGNKHYIYNSGNMSIAAQNIPPTPTNIRLGSWGTSYISILWDYPRPSMLCGFGANISSDIRFVIRYYKSSDFNCFYLGERTFNFHDRNATFNNVSRNHTRYIFYLSALSVQNNQYSSSWLKQLAAGDNPGTHYTVRGGVLAVFWQPHWSCHGNDIIEQAVICHLDSKRQVCFPVCQATLFQNGTVGHVASYSRHLDYYCGNLSAGYCKLQSNNVDLVNAAWLPSPRRMKCTLNMQCMHYLSEFKIKFVTYDIAKSRKLGERDCCFPNLLKDNKPSSPTGVKVIAIHQRSVTITWTYPKCEVSYFDVDLYAGRKGQKGELAQKTREEGSNFVYNFTITNLIPFTNYQIEVHAQNVLEKSTAAPYVDVQTKQGAPLQAPSITGISEERHGIKLTWKIPDRQSLQGIPKLTVIEVSSENNTSVFNVTLIGENITTAVLNVSDEHKCDNIRIKICNSQHLCSKYSSPVRLEAPCQNENPDPGRLSSNGNKIWPVVLGVLAAIFVVLLGVLVFCYIHKPRRISRFPLPQIREEEMECDTGDYMGIGQTSQPNEYDLLENEPTED